MCIAVYAATPLSVMQVQKLQLKLPAELNMPRVSIFATVLALLTGCSAIPCNLIPLAGANLVTLRTTHCILLR